MEEIEVIIVNWEKHQEVKKDRKLPAGMRHHWLKLSNTVYRSFSLHSLNNDERWCWLTILCLCSQKQSPKIRFTEEWFEWETRIPKETLNSCLKKLQCDSTATVLRHNCSTEKRRVEKIREDKRRVEEISSSEVPVPGTARRAAKPNPLNLLAWQAYREAYVTRYKVEPVRNASVNSQISAFVKRVGEEAPLILKFYLHHNDGFYLKQHHPMGLALKDEESVRTQWARGRAVTSNDVRQFEKTDHYRAQMERLEKGEL